MLKGNRLSFAGANEGGGSGGGGIECEVRSGTTSVSQLQMREVVTEVAALTVNIELPLWEAATVDGRGVGKMSTRTTEDENTVGWAASVPCCCCCWSAPVGFEGGVALNGGSGRWSGRKSGGMAERRQSRGSALWGGEGKNSETGSHGPAVLDECPLVRFISAVSSGVQESAQAHNMLVAQSALVRIVQRLGSKKKTVSC